MRLRINLFHFLLATAFLGTSIGLYISYMSGEVINLTDDNFEERVIEKNGPVLVAFTADW